MKIQPVQLTSSSSLGHRVGVFGGTFDPVHLGHLLIAEAALYQVPLDQVLWVPAACPPHKATSPLLAFDHRLSMLRQAIVNHPQFSVSTIEATQTGRSFAINTLLALMASYPNREWYWIIGQDVLQTLPKWHRHQDMIPQCQWLIAPRPWVSSPLLSLDSAMPKPSEPNVLRWLTELGGQWQVLQSPIVGLSSSVIRYHVAQGRSIRYWVPEPVREYINRHHLYLEMPTIPVA